MTKTEGKETKKTLSLSRPGKLELNKTVDAGQVRQSFSHGRSKMVAVEVKKKRTYKRDESGRLAEVKEDKGAGAKKDAARSERVEETVEAAGADDHLTDKEKEARARALELARLADAEAAEQRKRDAEAAKREVEEEIRRAVEETEKNAARESESAPEPETSPEPQPKSTPKPVARATKSKPNKNDGDGNGDRSKKPRPDAKPKQAPARRGEPRRRQGKLTIADALDDRERTRSVSADRRRREKEKRKLRQAMGEDKAAKVVRDVVVPEVITVQELANRMAERGAEVVKTLMTLGVMTTINQNIDADTAELVARELGHNVKRVSEADVLEGLKGGKDAASQLASRPPVVTVMGHVDHGKTSLLDALRETDMVSGEAGGITQHIGAYQVTMPSGDKITFIDTPGHAAFTEMRSRGAKVTDIVILVVAADDGVMPQTVEAIHHAKAAEAPIIVAINKMDKPEADPNRVRTELLQHELVVESMGGDVLEVEVSAKSGLNLDKLEEAVLLQAEILDIKSNPNRAAEGVVVEAKMERGRGSVATVLVQRGTLNVGDIFVAGREWGRVRALVDAHGLNLEKAGPAMPVEVLGLNGTPAAGDEVTVVDDENRAREVGEYRQRKAREAKSALHARGSLEQMFEKIREGETRVLPVVVKGDVHGSVEAIIQTMEKMATDEVKARVLHSGVGGINESDVTLARASGALIVGFNVRANPQARELARRDAVDIRYYSIIYDVTDDLKKALGGMMAPRIRENFIGYAEAREVFDISKVGKVAGCVVTEGVVKRGAKIRLLRDDVVVHEGPLGQLKRFKDDVKEVKEGYECGMSFENHNDVQVGDIFECYEIEKVAREL